MRGLALDDVTAALAADVHEVALLELFDKLGEAVRAVGFFGECRVELQHGGFQETKLRLHAAAFEHLESAFNERHGLGELERSRALAPLFSAESILAIRRAAFAAVVRTGSFYGRGAAGLSLTAVSDNSDS